MRLHNQAAILESIVYELPLHEQTRVLIRLEYLFDRLQEFVKKSNHDSIYLTLRTIDEILTILERSNLKKFLLGEIKDVSAALISWREHSLASVDKIDNLLNQLSLEKTYIESTSSRAGDILAGDEFLKNFRQKCNIPGGISMVDFPRFHHWLQQDSKIIQDIIQNWYKKCANIYRPIKLILSIIRQSATTSRQVAEDGFYQKTLDKNVEYKLIRVKIENNDSCFAQISGGRYHITVRMVHETDNGNIAQYSHDVKFILGSCKI